MDDADIQVIPNGEAIAPATENQCRAIRDIYGLSPNHRIISAIGMYA